MIGKTIKIFEPHQFEIMTSTLDSLFSKNPVSLVKSVDNGHATLKHYDANGIEVTEAGDDNLKLASIVSAVVDWMPPYDYILYGGELMQAAAPASDVRLWRIMNPDGGPQAVLLNAGGFNLKLAGAGATIKNMNPEPNVASYNAGSGTNKMRFLFQHSAGFVHNLQVNLYLTKLIDI